MQTQERAPRPRRGNGSQHPEDSQLDLRRLLRALQAVRDGDFSVRLASDQTGLAGKIADTFNEIVTSNQRLARRTGARRADRRQGRQDAPPHVERTALGRLGRDGSTRSTR